MKTSIATLAILAVISSVMAAPNYDYENAEMKTYDYKKEDLDDSALKIKTYKKDDMNKKDDIDDNDEEVNKNGGYNE